MAFTSASSIQKCFTYDVFLSFRGEDTRKNFVDHLYHALKQRGINTYKDDEEIKKGKKINDELIRSIKDSKFYIIVFSKNYASSSWCLDELVKIMECQNMIEHTAYPVFYDVEPTEVRNQSGPVEKAFVKHKDEEGVGKWRDALRQAADLAGWELKTTLDGHEAKFIQEIVKKISLQLSSDDLSVDGKLIGMETRVRDVVSSLETHVDDVRMIGIKGIGGGGKTTLARVVFDQISINFEGSSFVENLREVAKGSLGGLNSLKKQILLDVLHDPNIIVKDDSHFKKMLRGRKVLVVLDDVDHINQLEALAGELNWFKAGSRVIITTREEQVLIAHGVPKKLILNVNLLSHEEAICLFSRHAFGTQIPVQGYEDLSKQVVRYAAGLPLTIRVLGSDLCGKGELEWVDALERLKTIPLNDTLKKLELSYNSLEDDHKEIFLDVACLLKGWKKRKAINALESCGFHAISGLKVLELKSLITISESGCLDMHDHIEELGRNIVRRFHPNEPYKHSRLWNKEEVNNILVEDKCTEETRCIKVRVLDRVIDMKGLRKMKELRFLDVTLREEMVLKKLRFVHLYHCSLLRSLDIGLIPNLERLSLKNCDILEELHIPSKTSKLRFIDICYCRELRSLDIGLIPNLEGLSIVTCYALKTLNLERAENLETLEVKGSENLKEVLMPVEGLNFKHFRCTFKVVGPRFSKLNTLNLTRYPNLETLVLECKDLVELHMPIQSPKLKTINISCSKLRTLNLIGAHNLEVLDHIKCDYLLELQMPIESPALKTISIKCSKLRTLNLTGFRNLERLDLRECGDLAELHMPIESPKLKTINIHCSKLRTLILTRYRSLELLDLEQCDDLLELHMPIESLKLKIINISCSKLRTLNLIGAHNLEVLDHIKCDYLLELQMPVESPELKTISIHSAMLRTLNLTGSCNLERLDLAQCGDLVKLHMPIESPKLKTVSIPCSKLRTLNLTRYRNLEHLDLGQCGDLVELNMPIESSQLKTFNIHCSKLRTLNLTGYRNLERLELEQYEDLVELYMPIESPKLKTINIHCSKLRTLHLGLSPYLDCFDLNDCFTLEEIDAPIGCLSGHARFRPFVVYQGLPVVRSLAELHLTARSLGICSLHPDNTSPKFHFECICKDILPSWTVNLKKLITSFGICACTNLSSLSGIICGLQLRKLTLEGGIPEVPKELDQLECLEELTLLSTNIEHLPDSICMLKHLKLLQLKSCGSLKQLPENLGRLECLEELRLTDCTSLRDIPNSICEMKRLTCFHLINCILVRKLPKEMGRLQCLKELNIQGTDISDIPESIFQSEDLRFFS
ncbi:hypothetical protein SSX86_005937 [Deinandra increscens subsp. villosa]|uniref:TIR domain-containing protein n=1 Tax=Deinandra increscens subsp. villosa TaxID=3103831 RepID=A0AAP0DQT4_9ASTR